MIVFNKETRTMSQNQIARQRLCLTADKTALVDASDERAAFLFATPGDEILPEVAEQFGLVDGALPDFDAGSAIDDEAARIAAELEAAEKAAAEQDAAHEKARTEAEQAAAADKEAADKEAALKAAAEPDNKASAAPANKGGKAPANKTKA